MASGGSDALNLLSAALASSHDPTNQSQQLSKLRVALEAQPGTIPILYQTFMQMLTGANSVLRRWIVEIMELALCRPALSSEAKSNLAPQSLTAILGIFKEGNPSLVKTAVQCLASIYPSLIRFLCLNRSRRDIWDQVVSAKTHVLNLNEKGGRGVQLAAMKCFARMIQVQTKGPADPRLRDRGDPNLSHIPPDHPFLDVELLQQEGNMLLEKLVTFLFTNSMPDLVMAAINSLGSLAKSRPRVGAIVVQSLIAWTPAALQGQSFWRVRNVENTARLLLTHLLRNGAAGDSALQAQEALERQKQRMDQAAREHRQKREAEATRKREMITDELSDRAVKRQRLEPKNAYRSTTTAVAGPSGSLPGDVGGVEGAVALRRAMGPEVERNPLAQFDVTTLPINITIELLIATLQAVPEGPLQAAVQRVRDALNAPATQPPPAQPAAWGEQRETPTAGAEAADEVLVKMEPLDPLKIDMDEELEEFEPDRLNAAMQDGMQEPSTSSRSAGTLLRLENFALPPPEPLPQATRIALVRDSIARICDFGLALGGQQGGVAVSSSTDGAKKESPTRVSMATGSAEEIWMLLLARLATRGLAEAREGMEDAMEVEGGAEEGVGEMEGRVVAEGKGGKAAARGLQTKADTVRQMMFDFVLADFKSRVGFATLWMNEEWHNDRLVLKVNDKAPRHYTTWLRRLFDELIGAVDGNTKSLVNFLLDLPSIPSDIIHKLRNLCLNPDRDRNTAAFTTLREIATSRPTSRKETLNALLGLTTHAEKIIRLAAINTVRRWVPDTKALDTVVRQYASFLLRRLTQPPEGKPSASEMDLAGGAVINGDSANGTPAEAKSELDRPDGSIIDEYVGSESFELPPLDTEADVLRHVELPFVLSVKAPELLNEVMDLYPSMQPHVQEAVQKHISALVRSLGPSNSKLLTLLRNFPPGADSLALRILNVLTEKGRTPAIVALVKGLVSQREVDPRFLMPIMPDLNKEEIMKHVPRVITVLNSKKPEDEALVRSVFSSIVTTPPANFGTASTNVPRVRQSELLTPTELMVLLHEREKEIGLKATVMAITICFSMTDVYRAEVLAAVLQQLVDESELPLLFMRTVIMAVSAYKSLAGYVSTNLLTRLITKRVWNNPTLWDGFILCAKQTAPQSFAALCQLQKTQLQDVVEKQPALKKPLREYLLRKQGANRTKLAAYMEILSDGSGSDQNEGLAATPATPVQPSTSSRDSTPAVSTPKGS